MLSNQLCMANLHPFQGLFDQLTCVSQSNVARPSNGFHMRSSKDALGPDQCDQKEETEQPDDDQRGSHNRHSPGPYIGCRCVTDNEKEGYPNEA